MARVTTVQSYESVGHLAEVHRLPTLPKPKETWRLIQQPYSGEIIGLPSIRGFAVATNGIIVAVFQGNGSLNFGHLDTFQPDNEAIDKQTGAARSPKSTRRAEQEMEFI